MTAPFRALRSLDEVQHLRQLEGLDAGPLFAALAAEVAESAPATLGDLGQKLDAQRTALRQRASTERVQIERLKGRIGNALIRVVPRLDVELDSASGISVLARALA